MKKAMSPPSQSSPTTKNKDNSNNEYSTSPVRIHDNGNGKSNTKSKLRVPKTITIAKRKTLTNTDENVRIKSNENENETGKETDQIISKLTKSKISIRETDDYLTARAANPRTGVVSPSIVGTPCTPCANVVPAHNDSGAVHQGAYHRHEHAYEYKYQDRHVEEEEEEEQLKRLREGEAIMRQRTPSTLGEALKLYPGVSKVEQRRRERQYRCMVEKGMVGSLGEHNRLLKQGEAESRNAVGRIGTDTGAFKVSESLKQDDCDEPAAVGAKQVHSKPHMQRMPSWSDAGKLWQVKRILAEEHAHDRGDRGWPLKVKKPTFLKSVRKENSIELRTDRSLDEITIKDTVERNCAGTPKSDHVESMPNVKKRLEVKNGIESTYETSSEKKGYVVVSEFPPVMLRRPSQAATPRKQLSSSSVEHASYPAGVTAFQGEPWLNKTLLLASFEVIQALYTLLKRVLLFLMRHISVIIDPFASTEARLGSTKALGRSAARIILVLYAIIFIWKAVKLLLSYIGIAVQPFRVVFAVLFWPWL